MTPSPTILKIFYIDTQKNLLLLERELTQKEIDNRKLEFSFPKKALIVSHPIINETVIFTFQDIQNDYERLFMKYRLNIIHMFNIPLSAFREENKIFNLEF
jgi:hypothetical protein